MEYHGIKVDVGRLEELSRPLRPADGELEARNLRTGRLSLQHRLAQAIAALLFVEKKLPVVKRTQDRPSTDVAVLEALARNIRCRRRSSNIANTPSSKGPTWTPCPRWSIP